MSREARSPRVIPGGTTPTSGGCRRHRARETTGAVGLKCLGMERRPIAEAIDLTTHARRAGARGARALDAFLADWA